jgi:hypothetical protein
MVVQLSVEADLYCSICNLVRICFLYHTSPFADYSKIIPIDSLAFPSC